MEHKIDHTNDAAAKQLTSILYDAVAREASDIHLVHGFPAMFRVHGKLQTSEGEVLSPTLVKSMVEALLPSRLRQRMDEEKNFDCSVSIEHDDSLIRFRANAFLAQGHWGTCLRHVPNDIPTFAWMGFPEALGARLVDHRNGLVIITGVTGSGKSTTLAALLHILNQRGGVRILTVEEPIEYVHKPCSTSIITQREVGRDVDTFYDGLKFGLRQDPDVVLLGEIRDRETARMAITAAETGHLILATLHTKDAKGAITRLVDLFPHEIQDDMRTQLALSLRSVVSQHLLPSVKEGHKRALAVEILHVTDPVRIAIKFGKVESLDSAIQTGKRDGMMTLDDSLQRLMSAGSITRETAQRFARDPSQLM